MKSLDTLLTLRRDETAQPAHWMPKSSSSHPARPISENAASAAAAPADAPPVLKLWMEAAPAADDAAKALRIPSSCELTTRDDGPSTCGRLQRASRASAHVWQSIPTPTRHAIDH